MELKFAKSKRGGQILILANYKFHCNRKANAKVYWSCCEAAAGCTARCVTRGYEELIKEPGAHSGHPPLSPTSLVSLDILDKMRRSVVEQPQRSLQTIYNDVLQNAITRAPGLEEDLSFSLPSFKSCRMSLHRQRKKNKPVLPTERSDIQVSADLKCAFDGRAFLKNLTGTMNIGNKVKCESDEEDLDPIPPNDDASSVASTTPSASIASRARLNKTQATRKRKRPCPEDSPEDDELSSVEDEYEYFGHTVASDLRNMTREQQIHAKKLISDVLYEGQLGNLSRACVVYIDRQEKKAPPHTWSASGSH